MAKRKLRIRAARLEPELDRRIEVATKQGGFSNPSAFIRAAIERELAGRENGVDAGFVTASTMVLKIGTKAHPKRVKTGS